MTVVDCVHVGCVTVVDQALATVVSAIHRCALEGPQFCSLYAKLSAVLAKEVQGDKTQPNCLSSAHRTSWHHLGTPSAHRTSWHHLGTLSDAAGCVYLQLCVPCFSEFSAGFGGSIKKVVWDAFAARAEKPKSQVSTVQIGSPLAVHRQWQ